MDRKIIFFELNEVPARIFDYYCARHPESLLAKRLSESRVYDTYAEDEYLSPWVTWPTVHRGVSDEKHTIRYFGQPLNEVDKEFPPVWQMCAARGISTGVFGSLHSYPPPQSYDGYSFYMPDTFAAGAECFPDSLRSFQEFNLTMVKSSARNVSTKLPWAAALNLLKNLPELGFKASTMVDTAGQLVSERLNSARKVRRRTYQVVLAFDIFMHELERTQPAFCTFFTNHVASSMHRYWAAAFPSDYNEFGFTEEWVKTYRDEIDFTMDKFEAFFRRLIEFTVRHPEYELWVATSMGQAATEAKPLNTQLYLTDLERFMRYFGMDSSMWERHPAMEPRVSVCVKPELHAQLIQKLAKVKIGAKPLQVEEVEGKFISMAFGHPNLRDQISLVTIDGADVPIEELGLSHVDIEDLSNSSAYHIPQGRLFIYDPKKREGGAAVKISTRDIAPSLLKNFGIAQPSYMKGSASLVQS
jgi:hypothetical protein